MHTKQATTKGARKEEVKRVGYPAHFTSAGYLGYDDDKVRCLMFEPLHQDFNHSKMKVGSIVESDFHLGKVIRSVIATPLTCLREGNPRARAVSKESTRGQRGMCL